MIIIISLFQKIIYILKGVRKLAELSALATHQLYFFLYTRRYLMYLTHLESYK